MSPRRFSLRRIGTAAITLSALVLVGFDQNMIRAGHPALQVWQLPPAPAAPADNETTAARVELGKMLFFDARLSRDGTVSCASCHNPLYGWADGLPTAVGIGGEVLGRASPTIVNTAYNSIQMWDGREPTLESQALGPMKAPSEMHTDFERVTRWLRETPGYAAAFAAAYPDEPITTDTAAKALAAFERTVTSRNSPFDRWIGGDADAMTAQQVRGFEVFIRADKGNCMACHAPPNFTDNGFHNIGLAQFAEASPDMGRFAHIPVRVLKGAFKTPTLRDVTLTAPYFHDGSAETLEAVVAHYVRGGDVKTNLSPTMKPLTLTPAEQRDLVAFLHALTSPPASFMLPVLPPEPITIARTYAGDESVPDAPQSP